MTTPQQQFDECEFLGGCVRGSKYKELADMADKMAEALDKWQSSRSGEKINWQDLANAEHALVDVLKQWKEIKA